MFDAHLHNIGIETGGFLVGLEGEPKFNGTLSNREVLSYHNPNKKYIAFYYVLKKEIEKELSHRYLKYHPRREKYNPNEVKKSIKLNNPKCVMIDTLNEPNWSAYDYWNIAREFPNLQFVFAHSGGYLINEFIKICHFQKNVWIDFSLTHTTLAQFGKGLPYVYQAIEYALKSPFKDRLLMSTDYPFFEQEEVFNYYKKLNVIELLNNNYQVLKEYII